MTIAIGFGQEQGHTQSTATRYNCNFVYRIVIRHQPADDGVAGLVIGGQLLLVLAHQHRAALAAHHDLVLGVLEMIHGHVARIAARGEQRGFVDQVGEIRARKPRRAARDQGRIDVRRQRHLAHVHLEDLFAPAQIRQRHHDLAIEAARSQQRRIEHVRAIGRSDDDDAFVALETIHLDQQLVQRLLALIVTAAQAGAAMAADRVDLVDKDDARRMFFSLLEHVAHARGADADEHFHKVRTGNCKERYFRFAGDGLGQQGLAGTRRTDHQHTTRNAPAELLEFCRIAQEFDQLLDVILGLIDTGDIGEGDLDLILALQACA